LLTTVGWKNGLMTLVAVDLVDEHHPFAVLVHPSRVAEDTGRTIVDIVDLHWTPIGTRGGGLWRFKCPETGKIVHRLYLPTGMARFRSRARYNLGFAVKQE
jgi:hypothetical protein